MMESNVIKTSVKTVDNDITTIKLIETKVFERLKYESRGLTPIEKSYTIEIKQGLFITEFQYGYSKQKASQMFEMLIVSELDIYVDKFSSVVRACSLCDTKDTMLTQFDNGSFLCENCAAENGIDI